MCRHFHALEGEDCFEGKGHELGFRGQMGASSAWKGIEYTRGLKGPHEILN